MIPFRMNTPIPHGWMIPLFASNGFDDDDIQDEDIYDDDFDSFDDDFSEDFDELEDEEDFDPTPFVVQAHSFRCVVK